MITYSGLVVKHFFNQFWVGLVMWEIFEELCALKGVTPNAVAKATGVPQTTLSNWKKRRNIINAKAAGKIAEYFGVSLQYLLTGVEPPEDQVVYKSEDEMLSAMATRYFEEHPQEYFAMNDDLRLLFETVKDAPSDVLVRLRYYAEGLMAGRKDQT